jgi:outer membrane protein assembly factor BamE (lipoprotein component of BamABCDE complex)
MTAATKRAGSAALAIVAVATLSGCTRVLDHKGYVVDNSLIDTVAPGIDNRDSVNKTLGGPSFASEWDGGGNWYYLARDTRSLAFSTPHPVAQMLLTIRFDRNGNVASVQKTGMETIRDVRLYGKKTAVRGSEHSFFQELFGNINPSGANANGGGTADNPTNSRPGG